LIDPAPTSLSDSRSRAVAVNKQALLAAFPRRRVAVRTPRGNAQCRGASWVPRSSCELQIQAPEPDGGEHPLLAGSVNCSSPLKPALGRTRSRIERELPGEVAELTLPARGTSREVATRHSSASPTACTLKSGRVAEFEVLEPLSRRARSDGRDTVLSVNAAQPSSCVSALASALRPPRKGRPGRRLH